MQLSVNVQFLPFGTFKIQQVVQIGPLPAGRESRQEAEMESLILPAITIGDYVVQPAPVRVLNY